MRSSTRLLFAVVILALVGFACSGGDESQAEPAVSAVASSLTTIAAPTTTTTTVAPTITLSTTTTIAGPEIIDDGVGVFRWLPYAEGSWPDLDVYVPTTGEGPYPTIIGIHGGAFWAGSKNMYSEIGPYYAGKGYAFVSINYRLAPGNSYPAPVEDSFCSLAWVHANADEYGFDPNRVVVSGGSAGGYLAAMVGTVDDPERYLENCPHEYPQGEALHAAVIYYGLYDFTTMDGYPQSDIEGYLKDFWGAAYEDIPAERFEEMSPIKQIDGSEPPFIILHGTKDGVVPVRLSESFAEALKNAGVDVELVLLESGHAFELDLTGEAMTLALSEVDEFLERTLDP